LIHLYQFDEHAITVPFQDKEFQYPVYSRPIWDWAMDILHDQQMAPYFVWDAEWLYKFDGTKFVRFVHEPWTANSFWDVQVRV